MKTKTILSIADFADKSIQNELNAETANKNCADYFINEIAPKLPRCDNGKIDRKSDEFLGVKGEYITAGAARLANSGEYDVRVEGSEGAYMAVDKGGELYSGATILSISEAMFRDKNAELGKGSRKQVIGDCQSLKFFLNGSKTRMVNRVTQSLIRYIKEDDKVNAVKIEGGEGGEDEAVASGTTKAQLLKVLSAALLKVQKDEAPDYVIKEVVAGLNMAIKGLS